PRNSAKLIEVPLEWTENKAQGFHRRMVCEVCLRLREPLGGALCEDSWCVMSDHSQCIRDLLQRIRESRQRSRSLVLPLYLAEVRLGLLHEPVGPTGTPPLRKRLRPCWQSHHGGKVKDRSRISALIASFECPIEQSLERKPFHIARKGKRQNGGD